MKTQARRRWGKPFLVCAVFLLVASGLQALPVCPTTGTYQQLENFANGCTIGDKLFTDFTRGNGNTDGNAFIPTASQMTYTVINNGPMGPIGFDFSLVAAGHANGMSALASPTTPNGFSDASLTTSFNVQVFGSPLFLSGAQVCFTGSSTTTDPCGLPAPTGPSDSKVSATATPGFMAAALVGETVIANGNPHMLGIVAEGTVNQYDDSTVFQGLPAGQVLSVSQGINVSAIYPGAGPNNSASIKSFAETFTQTVTAVPEPGFYGLLAGGLGGIFLFVKRRQKTIKS